MERGDMILDGIKKRRFHPADVPQVLSDKERDIVLVPFATEPVILSQKGFRKRPIAVKICTGVDDFRVKSAGDLPFKGAANRFIGHFFKETGSTPFVNHLAKAQRHHVKQVIPAHQRVPGATKEIKPCAACDEESEFFAKKIIYPLEDIPPAMALMDFIKHDPRVMNIQVSGGGFKESIVFQVGLTGGNVIPVEI
jgi:hypothetical protein